MKYYKSADGNRYYSKKEIKEMNDLYKKLSSIVMKHEASPGMKIDALINVMMNYIFKNKFEDEVSVETLIETVKALFTWWENGCKIEMLN